MNMKAAVAALAALLSLPVAAAEWTLVPAGSKLAFAGTAQGEAFEGQFERFEARVSFDPGNAALGAIEADIDVASVDSANAERDETLVGAEFFAVDRFPKAQFRAGACKALAPPQFECAAKLTIRDKSVDLPFRFTWTPDAGGAKLHAEVKIDRLAFDVGTGDWADEEMVAREVRVTVDLALTAKQ